MMADFRDKLIPSILTDSMAELTGVLGIVDKEYRRAMLTIVDGVFADNLSVAIEDLESLAVGPDLELHLATEYPTEFLGSVMSVGVKKVWAQIERMGDIGEYIEVARELGLSPRVALDLYTPTESVKKVLEDIDGVLVWGSRAGNVVDRFEVGVLEKVEELRKFGFEKEVLVGVVLDEGEIEVCMKSGVNGVLLSRGLWEVKN